MKNASAHLEVHFYEEPKPVSVQDRTGEHTITSTGPVSVLIEIDRTDDREFCNILLFSTFVLRQLVNLGEGKAATLLAAILLLTEKYISSDKPEHHEEVVPYAGQGIRQFVGDLNGVDGTSSLWLDVKGFSLAGKDVELYAIAAVEALRDRLSSEDAGNQSYLGHLATAGVMCARVWSEGHVTIANQHQLALTIAQIATESVDRSNFSQPGAAKVAMRGLQENRIGQALRQLVPVGIGTAIIGTIGGVLGQLTGSWTFGDAFSVVFSVLFLLWILGLVFGARR